MMSIQDRLYRDWCYSKCYSNHDSANQLKAEANNYKVISIVINDCERIK